MNASAAKIFEPPKMGYSKLPVVFKSQLEQINWKEIVSIELDKLPTGLNYENFINTILQVAFCNIQSEFPNIDTRFIKLFKISQIGLEILINKIEALKHQVEKEQKIRHSAQAKTELELNKTEAVVIEKNRLIECLKKSLKKKSFLMI